MQLTLYPTGDAVFQAIDTCTCTVAGKSGTVVFYEQGTVTLQPTGYQLSSTVTIIKANGQLTNLQGQIACVGLVDPTTGLTSGTYSGQIQSAH